MSTKFNFLECVLFCYVELGRVFSWFMSREWYKKRKNLMLRKKKFKKKVTIRKVPTLFLTRSCSLGILRPKYGGILIF